MPVEQQDKSNQLRVISFEPHLVQIEIVDFKKWKEENSDNDIKIGSFLKIEDGNEKNILVLVKSFKMKPKHLEEETATEIDEYFGTFVINTQPVGQLEKRGDKYEFIKGIKNISIPPNGVSVASDEEIKNIFSIDDASKLIFSEHLVNPDIKIEIDGDKFFSKHIAVVGSTGSGKSCTVAKIIQEAKSVRESQALNNSHIIIFDIHGEYDKAFPNANSLSVENNSLKLPYWLMNSEELEDMFIESNEQPQQIAAKCLRHAGVKFALVNISNRGTQVWPTGSVFTNLVNQYNARFESLDGTELNQQDIIGLYVSLSGNFKICSLELLNMWGDKKAYSLAQGQ